MEVIRSNEINNTKEAHAVALGMFDGVHLGHKKVIQAAINFAKENNIKSAIITLENHPRELTRGQAPLLLTTLESRLAIFEELGVDTVLVLKFDEKLMNTGALEYLDTYLNLCLNAQFISTGYDHHFGKNRSGTPELLLSWCRERSVTLEIVTALEKEDSIISSSRIRDLITDGKLDTANLLLGHDYKIIGRVIKGDQRGRELGFPTANLEASRFIAIPANGVYKGRCRIKSLGGDSFNCAVNIGVRPSFKDDMQRFIEVHILDFNQSIYGEDLEVDFIERLREEKKFSSIDELKAQIESDVARCK